MQTKEEKICTFTQKGTRLQLIKITSKDIQKDVLEYYRTGKVTNIWCKYQVRLNRKIIDTNISEYEMRKLFATYAQNIITT